MREILPDLDRWVKEEKAVALATVVQTWGSSPRRVGAKMAVTAAGEITGSVSGGCVEGAVAETAFQVLETGNAAIAPLWCFRRDCLGSGPGLRRADRRFRQPA